MALALDQGVIVERESTIRLLGGFGVVDRGQPITLPTDAQRVVAFLALHPHSVPRSYVAGSLWLDATEERAFGNLRSALWRLRQRTSGLIETADHNLALNATTDIAVTAALADRLCTPGDCNGGDYDIAPFSYELLPGWYDEFVLVERERLRQTSLHALEAIAQRLTAQGRFAAAITAALAAIRLDPLRESAHRAAITVHLAEGNHSEAIRQYHTYAELLNTELELTPSPLIRRLFTGQLEAAIEQP